MVYNGNYSELLLRFTTRIIQCIAGMGKKTTDRVDGGGTPTLGLLQVVCTDRLSSWRMFVSNQNVLFLSPLAAYTFCHLACLIRFTLQYEIS